MHIELTWWLSDKIKSIAIEYREYLDDVVFEKLMSYGDLYV